MLEKETTFWGMIVTLFLVLNSFAQIPVFMALLANFDAKKQKIIIIREMLIALVTLLIFVFFGSKVLGFLQIDHYILSIAGGFLLIIISLNMIFPKKETTEGVPHHEPLIVPLAIPCIAGPATITTLILFSKKYGIFMSTAALFVAWVPTLLVVLSSAVIRSYLGDKGLQAVERLGGMLICLIGTQMFALGIIELVKNAF